MRGADNRVPLLAAIAAVLLLAAIPGPVQAASPLATFDAATCMSNQANAYTAYAQGQTTAQTKIWDKQTKPDMKKVFCWQNIQNVFAQIGNITSNAGIFGNIFWTLVDNAISSMLNSLCQAVVGAIQSAVNMLKNLLCIPLPGVGGSGFNIGAGFSLGSFGGGTCNGIQLLNLGGSSATRPMQPGAYSPLWNYTPH